MLQLLNTYPGTVIKEVLSQLLRTRMMFEMGIYVSNKRNNDFFVRTYYSGC